MEKKLIPNFTQIPNIILDEYISELGHAEIKVLLYICRRTYGFQKGSDKISLTQFEKGITSANGEQLDHGTGLGRKAIISALNTLSEKGLIVKNDEKNINSFSMQLVSLGNHTSVVKIPELVSLRHPQKKEKESIQKKDITTGKLVTEKEKTVTENSATVTEKSVINNEISEVISLMEKVDPKNKTYYGNKTQRSACKFLIETYSFDNVVKVVNLLPQTNTQEYFPRITSPYELQEKWQKLAIALSSAKRKDNELVNQMII